MSLRLVRRPRPIQLVGGSLHAPSAPTIAGTVTIGGTATRTAGVGGGPVTGTYAYRDGVLVGAVSFPYTYVAADVGPALTWKDYGPGGTSAASNTLQWTPMTPTTPAWWLRGDSVTLNGSTVSSWLDQSGNARDWSQGSAPLQPTYTASAINGQPGLTFSAAAGQYLQAADISALTGAETFLVMQLNADPPATSAKCGLWRIGNGGSAAVVPFTDGTIYDDFGSTTRKTTVNPTPTLAAPRIYSVISVAGEWTNYLDGAQLFTTATNTAGFQTAPKIGGSVSSSNYLDGVVCEWITYPAKLSSGNRADVIAYLKNRYGIA